MQRAHFIRIRKSGENKREMDEVNMLTMALPSGQRPAARSQDDSRAAGPSTSVLDSHLDGW